MAKKADVRVGQVYRAVVNGREVPCRIDLIEEIPGRASNRRTTPRQILYRVTNLATGRRTTFRSAMKFRELVQEMTAASGPKLHEPEGEQSPPFGPMNLSAAPTTAPSDCSTSGAAKEDEQRSDPTLLSTAASKSSAGASNAIAVAAPTPTDAAPRTTGGSPLSSALHRAAARECKPVGDGPVAGMSPTDEQRAGLAAAAEVFGRQGGPRVLVLVAGAGCGKTATLRMLEEALPGQGQYTAFNSAIVKDSAAKFRRAACNTTHSLAFRDVGKLYKARLGGKRVRSAEVARMLGIEALVLPDAGTDDATGEPKPKVLQADFLASRVMMALKRFCQSADLEVAAPHFRRIEGIDRPDADGGRTSANNDRVCAHLLPFARAAWVDLASPDGTLPFAHDVYVKVWQLGRPHIPADYILLDEAQDTAPVMLDVLRQQGHAMLVLVGDDNQQIYEWRGAVNALGAFPGAPRSLLSQSFRFGQAVADVANAVLRTLDEPTDLVLRGLPSIPSRVGPVERPRCHLFRTNAGAVGCVLAGLAERRRGHLVGGGADVVDFVKAVIALQQGRGTGHPELACFSSWTEVEAFAKTEEGEDLALMVRLVKRFGAAEILRALEQMPSEAAADFVACTAHKSKGREWPTVKLGADFPTADRLGDSDRRLLYVAATRAQEELDVTECPPFSCRERARTEDEGEGGPVGVPVIEVAWTAPMPTPEQLGEWRAGKYGAGMAVAQPASRPCPEPAANGNGKPSAAEAPATFTWANLGDGWLVRGPKVEVGARVTVVRRNGTTSVETVKAVVKQLGELWFYRVGGSS